MILMQFHEMKDIDIKLSLLGGDKIDVGNLSIYPYTLKEIRGYGYSKYMENLQWISLGVDDFISSVNDENKKEVLLEQKDDLKAFDFFVALGGVEMRERLISVLKMVLKNDDINVLGDKVLAVDFVKHGIYGNDEEGKLTINRDKFDEIPEEEIKLIHRDNFDNIIKVVKFQNYLEQVQIDKEAEEQYADIETKKLMEQMKALQDKVKQKKKLAEDESENDIDIADIISAVGSMSNSINKFNIWNLTIYQLYDEYSRLDLIDNYEFSIKAMMAGVKTDINHWSSKIN